MELVRLVETGEDRMQLLVERSVSRRELDVLRDANEVERPLLGIPITVREERGQHGATWQVALPPIAVGRALARACARTEERNHLPLCQPSHDHLAVPLKRAD